MGSELATGGGDKTTDHTTWKAFVDTLGQWAYWFLVLAILLGGIAYFTRRSAWKKTGQRQKK